MAKASKRHFHFQCPTNPKWIFCICQANMSSSTPQPAPPPYRLHEAMPGNHEKMRKRWPDGSTPHRFSRELKELQGTERRDIRRSPHLITPAFRSRRERGGGRNRTLETLVPISHPGVFWSLDVSESQHFRHVGVDSFFVDIYFGSICFRATSKLLNRRLQRWD